MVTSEGAVPISISVANHRLPASAKSPAGVPISSFLTMATAPTFCAGWNEPWADQPRRTERKSASTRGHSMIIDIIVIAGTAFGILVTLGLLMVYLDNHRSGRHQQRDLDGKAVLGRHMPELPKSG
jgi:hypothetical protein